MLMRYAKHNAAIVLIFSYCLPHAIIDDAAMPCRYADATLMPRYAATIDMISPCHAKPLPLRVDADYFAAYAATACHAAADAIHAMIIAY